jgi:DNA transformation protein and related proteins
MPRTPTRRKSSLHVSDAFKAFVLDQLSGIGEVVPRSMFGGVGLYHRGIFFAILARDVLYLKVDDFNRADYERAGMSPFKPFPGRPTTLKYYAVPVGVLESAGELEVWAHKAVAAAERSV